MSLTRLADGLAVDSFNWVDRKLQIDGGDRIDPQKLRTWSRKVPVVVRRNGLIAALLIAQREQAAQAIMAKLLAEHGADLNAQVDAIGNLADKRPFDYLTLQVKVAEHALWIKRAAEAIIPPPEPEADSDAEAAGTDSEDSAGDDHDG